MINPCSLITLPARRDERGSLAFSETGKQLPFEVRREFHLFDLKMGIARGGHSHKICHQFMTAMAGEFKIITDSGSKVFTWTLSSPGEGLFVPPGHCVELTPLSKGSVLSVLASHAYDEADYIRDREQFIRYVHSS